MAAAESASATAERLDQYVARHVPAATRSAAAHLIAQGRVTVNGTVQSKAGYKLKPGDQVHVDYDPAVHAVVPEIELPVLYEDDDCVVINKPAGVLTHSKGAFNPEATVATWLRSRVQGGLEGERAGIVHRLDRATSGVMICAKTPAALAWLQKQFSQRKVQKTYAAVVAGTMSEPEAVIDMPIERNPKRPQTFRAGSNGRPALTAYQVLHTHGDYSLLELRPTTGRTHQLRVHLAHLGHPIVGDTLYGGQPADRLFLHAHSLTVTMPNKTRQTFTVPVPAQFAELVRS
ncbi:MAG TPA: RluA family pseudouridine synthase [Candidatus Saccharimonadales bacterium]|nr:RluA family pseudouridine synthase [Candidatus Saccharimonadales bacterium]